MNRTVARNTGVIAFAAAQNKSVRFTYVDANGKKSRRTVLILNANANRAGDVIVRAQDGQNIRSFRTDRMMRAVIV